MSDDERPPAKTSLDRRSLMLGSALLIGGGLTALRQPHASARPVPGDRFEAMIPAKVGGWTSHKSAEVILPPRDEASDKLYQNLETRIYVGDGLPSVMFLCAYSSVQQNDVQVHRPEICYPASGYPIIKNIAKTIAVDGKQVNARFLIADRGGAREMILYWIRVGDRFPVDWRGQRIEMAKANLAGTIPDGVLLRISTILDDEAPALDWLLNFSNGIKNASGKGFQSLIFGP
jgi:EpsI family protein